MSGWAWFWMATTLLAFAGQWFLLVQWRRSIRHCEEALPLLRRANRRQAEQEWDDAIHVASPEDPLRIVLPGAAGDGDGDPVGSLGSEAEILLHQRDRLAQAPASRSPSTGGCGQL